MSQTGQQTKTMHTLPNISRSKGNQAIKFSQLIIHSVRNMFYVENEVGKLVSDLFLFFKKVYIK